MSWDGKNLLMTDDELRIEYPLSDGNMRTDTRPRGKGEREKKLIGLTSNIISAH